VATAVLLYSEFEPYREFVERLGAKLRDAAEVVNPDRALRTVGGLGNRGCFILCTNVTYLLLLPRL